MSDFEYTDLSSEDSGDEEIIVSHCKQKKIPECVLKMSRELRLHYSNLFIDSFTLIDLFVKSKILTYEAFLVHFDTMKFHQIYAKPNKDVKRITVAPHHYITTTQDALAVASKFLRSRSKNARIGAIYLLYTLYKTQPLKHYPINIKLEPKDYHNTKNLVDRCLFEGILHPSYCFYDLDLKKNITITACAVNPCLEANYPRTEIRKHMGRVADKHFATEYEERREFDPTKRLQLMEDQMRNELTYVNKLTNLTLGHDFVSEYKPELSKLLVEINMVKAVNTSGQKVNEKFKSLQKKRFKNKKCIAFPGKNENVLDDMVTIAEIPKQSEPIVHSHPKKRRKISKKKNDKNVLVMKEEPCSSLLPKLSDIIHSDSSISSTESEDYVNGEDQYGDMIWQFLKEDDDNEVQNGLSRTVEND